MSSDNMDLDLEDEFADDVSVGKPSLKDMWDNNPFLKIGAVVIGIVVAGFVYMAIFSGEEKVDDKDASMMRVTANAKGVVGETTTAVYKQAVEDSNKTRANIAKSVGGSALPTPIGQVQGQLDVSRTEEEESSNIDPLQEWRRSVEARRFEIDFSEDPTDAPAPVPEITPIIEPIRPQTEVIQDPELVNKLVQQMQLIIASKAPDKANVQRVTTLPSEYAVLLDEREKNKKQSFSDGGFSDGGFDTASSGGGSMSDTGGAEAKDDRGKVMIAAGQIAYAQLLNDLNSDVPTPVLAHVLAGPLKGGRAIGEFSMQDKYLTLTFSRIVKDDITYPVEAIALDPETTLGGMVSDVDNHYFSRIVLPAATEFISGFAEAATQTQQTVVSDGGGGAVQSQEDLDTREELLKGVKEAADSFVEVLEDGQDRPITVKLYRGTPMGMLFLETLRETDGE